MRWVPVRGVSLCVDVVGKGPPLLLMHGGPGADHFTLGELRALKDRFTLVFYDHRCNGRSVGAPIESFTWENLTADADALREQLGFVKWAAVLGHSFGGHVALEYALRYPRSLSSLILVDTAGEARWAQEHAPEELRRRGYPKKTVALARRFFNGEIEPREMRRGLMKFGSAYYSHPGPRLLAREAWHSWRTRLQPGALIFANQHLTRGWSAMERLGQLQVPTLVLAGRDDFIFPPEAQRQLAAAIPHAQLRIVDDMGHNPSEQLEEVLDAVNTFLHGVGAMTSPAVGLPGALPERPAAGATSREAPGNP